MNDERVKGTLRLKRDTQPQPMDGDAVTEEIRRLLEAQDAEGEALAMALATLPD